MKIKREDRFLLYFFASLLSPFVTWRIYDWYMQQIESMWEKLQWSQGEKAFSGIILFLTVAISLVTWLIERDFND